MDKDSVTTLQIKIRLEQTQAVKRGEGRGWLAAISVAHQICWQAPPGGFAMVGTAVLTLNPCCFQQENWGEKGKKIKRIKNAKYRELDLSWRELAKHFVTSVELYLPLYKIWPAIFAAVLIANLTLEFKWC